MRQSCNNHNVIKIPIVKKGECPSTLELDSSKLYHFDGVFPPSSMQEEVFKEVKPFIQSAIDGENVCIFAYGQTGAGKTFTMEGPPYLSAEEEISEISGILPRTA